MLLLIQKVKHHCRCTNAVIHACRSRHIARSSCKGARVQRRGQGMLLGARAMVMVTTTTATRVVLGRHDGRGCLIQHVGGIVDVLVVVLLLLVVVVLDQRPRALADYGGASGKEELARGARACEGTASYVCCSCCCAGDLVAGRGGEELPRLGVVILVEGHGEARVW